MGRSTKKSLSTSPVIKTKGLEKARFKAITSDLLVKRKTRSVTKLLNTEDF